MEEIIDKVQNDSALMLMMGMGVVVLLVIVLVIVVSAMRVKSYKEKFWYVQADNKDKALKIEKIESTLQTLNIENANYIQKLEQFDETKVKLSTTHEEFLLTQKEKHELEKLQSQTQTKLENSEQQHISLTKEFEILKEKHDNTMENNSKFRTNNARLLMKLESEERCTLSQKEMMQSYKKEMHTMLSSMVKKIDDEHAKEILKALEEKFKKA